MDWVARLIQHDSDEVVDAMYGFGDTMNVDTINFYGDRAPYSDRFRQGYSYVFFGQYEYSYEQLEQLSGCYQESIEDVLAGWFTYRRESGDNISLGQYVCAQFQKV